MKYAFSLLFLLLFTAIHAQEIKVNRKTGLVTLNGREFCYIMPASKGSVKQFNVQNLEHRDLIFVSENEGRSYNAERQTYEGDEFRVVFLGTRNWCSANGTGIGYNNYLKIARMLVSERLLQNDEVWPESERLFIRKHQGVFNTRIEPGSRPAEAKAAAPATEPAAPVASASAGQVRITGDKAYIGERLIGSFRGGRTEQKEFEEYIFYGTDDVQVAMAQRMNQNADWIVRLPGAGKSYVLRYYPDRTLERLFQSLLDKGYLK